MMVGVGEKYQLCSVAAKYWKKCSLQHHAAWYEPWTNTSGGLPEPDEAFTDSTSSRTPSSVTCDALSTGLAADARVAARRVCRERRVEGRADDGAKRERVADADIPCGTRRSE